MVGGRLRVLMVASEAVPFAKTGGLADVVGALPEALAQLGCEVRCVLPRYRQVGFEKFGLRHVALGGRQQFAGERIDSDVWTVERSGVSWYFIDAPAFYDRDHLYTVDGEDYPDNFERFTFFAQQALALIKRLDWRPDVIHCHDWQTALIPVYLKIPVKLDSVDTTDPFYDGIRTLFTIHNIAYQGLFPKQKLPAAGIGWEHYTIDKLEYWGKLNFLKAALALSDRLSTVSKRYSEEIQTSEAFGRGMEGLLAWRSKDLAGILNGIDDAVWNPETDPHIAVNYGAGDLRGKTLCKRSLLGRQGLDVKPKTPLIGMISRLDAQKGFDLIGEALPDIMDLGVQMVILGTGAPEYHELLERAVVQYPGRLAANLRFDNVLAHQIEAGSDMFLMPSKFEPCGLSQMYSLRYGTIPIVHATGGLYDTITDYDPEMGTGNGFSFSSYTPEALTDAVRRAVGVFSDRKRWFGLARRGMSQDFSWKASAARYIELYEGMIR